MKIAIFGGTGFIGSAWVDNFTKNNGEVVLFTRRPDGLSFVERPSISVQTWPIREPLHVDGVINLAGETINQRWTRAAKARIFQSRIETTKTIVQAIAANQLKTDVLINASAVGYYGHSLDKTFTEDDGAPIEANDFLGTVTAAWEAEADKVKASGVRLVKARFGVALARNGGAFPKMALPYRLFVGGPIGRGNQWLSWIHQRDAVRLLDFCLRRDEISGPVNFTAPEPATMNEFGKTIAKTIRRPHWLPLPTFVCKSALGEMSDLILKGQKAIPKKAEQHGFSFQYPDRERALREIFITT